MLRRLTCLFLTSTGPSWAAYEVTHDRLPPDGAFASVQDRRTV
jgi:hypothetical protein